jgi:hypothetical protein
MKQGSLFVLFRFVLIKSTEPGCIRLCSWSLWKALEEGGALAWFHGIWTCSVELLEYGMISSITLNHWNVHLVLLERS